jgi:O-antigen ligase
VDFWSVSVSQRYEIVSKTLAIEGTHAAAARLKSCGYERMKGLLITYAIVLVGAVISLRQPVTGLFIYVGLSVLRPEAIWGWAGDMRGLSKLEAVPLLVGWAFQGFGSWRFGKAKAIVWSLILFGVWATLSGTQAVDGATAADALLEFQKTFLPFLIGITMIKTEKQAKQLLWVIILCQGYVSLDMNRMYLDGYNRANAEGFGGMDNNSFGISLLTVLGGALALAMSSTSLIAKAVAGGITLVILHTVLLTFSRGAFVGLLAVGAAAIWIFPKRPKYLAPVLAAALIAVMLTGPELSARLATTFAPREERDGSAESRFDLWKDCFTVIGREPIFGVGPRNWGQVADEFGWPKGKEAHSLWVQTAAEVGVPGFLFFFLFYTLTIKRLWPIARGRSPGVDKSTALFAAGLILGLVGFAVSAQFVTVEGLEPPYWMTMIGAILLKSRSLAEEAPAVVPEPSKKAVPLAPAIALRPRQTLVRPPAR